MKLFCDLGKSKRVSKKGTNYEVTLITLKCKECGVSMVIEDFKVSIPFEVNDMEITIEKVDNRYVIKELNYTIGWAYSMGISLLLSHIH